MNAAAGIAHGDDGIAGIGTKPRELLSGIAEALDGHGRTLGLAVPALHHGLQGVKSAVARGRGAAHRAAHFHRLAGNHGAFLGAVDDAVLVHHPAHHARVGVHVRRGDVGIGADEIGDLVDIGARQALHLGRRKLLGVDADTALAAAERQTEHGAFHGHPERQRRDLVGVHVRMKADTALGRAKGVVVAHPVAGIELHRAVVVAQRHGHLERGIRLGQLLGDVVGNLRVCQCGFDSGTGTVEQAGHDNPKVRESPISACAPRPIQVRHATDVAASGIKDA